MCRQLTLVIPTVSERKNIQPPPDLLDQALIGISREVLVVDNDSPNGTTDLARELAHRIPRVRCLRRIGRRGLSSACIEGFPPGSAPFNRGDGCRSPAW